MQNAIVMMLNSLYVALAAFALGKAMFRSFWATEFRNRLIYRDKQRFARLGVLRWELANRIKYSADAAAKKPHAARVELSDAELAERQREVEAFVQSTLWQRALMYFLGCVFCQSFWAGVIVAAFCARPFNLMDPLIAGTVGYLLAEHPLKLGAASNEPDGHGAGCPTCGKNKPKPRPTP